MKSKQPNFYSVIIGTELLNGRRKDAHFAFLNEQLLKRGWTQKASFVIVDDPSFMNDVFKLIQNDENSVLFCFGGIGSTPDDYTRKVAADAFTNGSMQIHEEAKQLIENEFGKEAYPHRIHMANIPIHAKLLYNVVNNVPGFYLQERFFFMPGFPSMSQSMIEQALNCYYPKNTIQTYRKTMTALCSESALIDIMKQLPSSITLSSLPRLQDNKRSVVISLESIDEKELHKSFKMFENHLNNNCINYLMGE